MLKKTETKKYEAARVIIDVPAPRTTVDELRSCDVTQLLEVLSALQEVFGGLKAEVRRLDKPVEVTCPHCGKKARVRRVWRADVTANTGIEGTSPISVYPIEDADTYVDESNFDQWNPFYCGSCGEDIASTEQELIDLLKKEENA